MSRYGIVDNPTFVGRKPTLMEPACHDRTPFISFECAACGEPGHLHESQIPPEAASWDVFVVRCFSCLGVGELSVASVRKAFADMRAAGWYA